MSQHTTGILLAYYPPYFNEAVRQFNRLLETLPGRYSIVVVNNGPAPGQPGRDHVVVISGDNSTREFSGWDAGVEHCRRNGLLEDSDLVVFANDTSCHHNKFGPFTQSAFRRALRRLLEAPHEPVAAGEIHALGKPFVIDGLTSDRWIATYLFGLSRAAMLRLGCLTPPRPLRDFYCEPEPGRLKFASDVVSPNLARHIEDWLLGSGNTRWPGNAAIGARTLAQLRGKADSVLCEKHLSARLLANGGSLVDVFGSPVLRHLRRIEAIAKRWPVRVGRPAANVY